MNRGKLLLSNLAQYAVALVSGLLIVISASSLVRAEQSVTVFFGSDATYLPFIIAEKKGYYEDEGLDVTQRLFVTGVEAMLSFKTLNATFIASSAYAAMPLWHEDGSNAVAVANFYSAPDNQKVIARTDIKTPEDLEGKTVATRIGSSAEYFLHAYLNKNNIDVDSVRILDLTPPEAVAALVKGEVDAIFFWEPTPTTAIQAMGQRGNVLSTARDYYVERVALTANKDFAEANPETVERFIIAIGNAIDFIKSNPEEAIAIGSETIRADPSIVKVIVDQNPFTLRWDTDALKEYDRMASFSAEIGRIKAAKPTLDIFDERYLESAMPEMVR